MMVLGLVDIPWWGILFIAIITFLVYDTWDFDYFKKQGIPGPRPIPIFGTLLHTFTKALPYVDLEAFKKYGDKGYYGVFLGTQPMLIVYDTEMLSEITVKQFQAFTNHNTVETNSILDQTVGSLKDARWKYVRTEMSPTFSTGKLKQMNSEIDRCAQTLVNNLLESTKTDDVVNLREYIGPFSMDLIATTAFGIRLESQKDWNNAFVTNAKRALNIDTTNIQLVMSLLFPKLAKFLMKFGFSVPLIKKDVQDFFSTVVKETMEMKKGQEDQTRTDFIQLMMKGQRSVQEDNETKGLTNNEIVANTVLFLVAAYEVITTAVTFFLYNMARYPDVQDKLVKEINDVIGDADSVDYNLLQDMPYLDQCVNESLRLYTPNVRVDRVAKHDITIKGVFIRKGVAIGLPLFTLARDPKRWPNPEEFNPDRFSPENKKKHHPLDFLPFGAGPRACMGSRLAQQEIKMAAIHVLKKVKVRTCAKTQIPVIFAKNIFGILQAEGGIYLKLEPRSMQ